MFKTTVADGMGFDEDGKVMPEETIKAALVPNRIELCTIWFHSKALVEIDSNKEIFVGYFAQVIELCDEWINKTLSQKNK